jgi:outer membrane lipoprotein-sorting protein
MDSRKSVSPRHAALAVWMAALCVPALAAGADQLQATFDRMDRAAARFKGLSAEVTQVSHNALLNEDEAFTGTTAVRRGPKQRDLRAVVDILHPDPKKVLLTGHKVEMYYPKTNTKQIIDLDKKGSKMVDQFLLLGFGSASVEIRNAYTVELGGPETVAGQKTVRLVLTPKSPDVLAKLTKVELWISDTLGIAVQQKFWEPGGDYELTTYTNVKLNPVPQELKWDIPKNAVPEKLN